MDSTEQLSINRPPCCVKCSANLLSLGQSLTGNPCFVFLARFDYKDARLYGFKASRSYFNFKAAHSGA
jgi:hypothetical protein